MNSSKSSFIPFKLQNFLVLALLLGGLCATRVSNAQSVYLTNALKAAGDSSGVPVNGTPTEIDNAFANLALQSATNSTILTDFSSDLNYALNNIGSTNANADFSNILGSSLFRFTGANFALVSGSVAAATDPNILDSNKFLVSYQIGSAAVQLSETQVIANDTIAIAESMSAGASFDSNVGLVITGATYSYYVPPNNNFSQNLAAIPILANTIVENTPNMTISDIASVAQNAYQYELSAALVTGTTVEGTALSENSVSAAGTVAYDFSLDVQVYSPNFAAFAAAVDSINLFAVVAISGSAATAAPLYAPSIATAVAQVVPSADGGPVAGAIASVPVLSDSARDTVAENIVDVDNTQAPAVGGDVAPSLTNTDKAFLAYYLGTEVSGTINRAGDVPSIATNIAATLSGTDPTLGADEGLVAFGGDYSVLTSASASTLVSYVATGVAGATVSGSMMSYSVQATIAQTIVGDLGAGSLAIVSATSVEQVAYTDYASVSGSNAPSITSAFAADVATHDPGYAANLAALGAGDYPTYAAAVSGSATAALSGSSANLYAPSIATSVAQVVNASYAAPIAAAITGVLELTDTSRFAVAENIISVDLSQDVLVSGAVAPNVTNLDKAYLAYYVGTEVNGDSKAGDIPSIANAIAVTIPGTDSTLGADEGLIAYGADLPVVTSSSASTLVSEVATNVAGATVSGSAIPVSVQATIAQTIAGYLDPTSGTMYPSLALASATSVEQVAYTDFASGGSNAPSITGAFATDLATHYVAFIPNLAALGATDYAAFAPAISGSATNAAPLIAAYIATSVAQVTGTGAAAPIASAIASAPGLVALSATTSDPIRWAVAENIVDIDQAEDALVAGAVAPDLTNLDKAYLAYYIGVEVSGTIGRATDLPTIASDVAATVSATDSTLGADEGLIAYGAGLSGSTGGLANTLIPEIANAVASVILSGSDLPLAAQGTIVQTMDSNFPSQATITSTTVELTAITDQTALTSSTAARVAVATLFATDVPTQSVNLAQYAAGGQTGTEAGLIGAKVAGISASVASTSGSTIAVAVSNAAIQVGNAIGVHNDTLAAVATQFALNSGAGTGQIAFQYDSSIAQALAQQVVFLSGTFDALDSDAVGSIVQAFASQGLDANDLVTLLGNVIKAVPYDAADTLAAFLRVLPNGFEYTDAQIESYVDSIIDEDDLTLLGLTEAEANNDITLAYNDEQSPNFGGPNEYENGITPDETPVVEMVNNGP